MRGSYWLLVTGCWLLATGYWLFSNLPVYSLFLFLFLVLDSLFKQVPDSLFKQPNIQNSKPKILLPLLPKYQPSYENHHQPAYAFHSQEIFTTDQPFYTPEYLCILCRKQEGMPGLRKEIQKAPSLWQDCQTR